MTINQFTFGAGAINPRMEGRIDTSYPSTGLALAENVLITGQGSVVRRPGTNYLAKRANGRHIIPYTQSGVRYLLFFGHLTVNISDENGTSLGTETTPYQYVEGGANELKDLSTAEHDGWLYIAHPARTMRRLRYDTGTLAIVIEAPTVALRASFSGTVIQSLWTNTNLPYSPSVVASWRGRLILSGRPAAPTAIASPTLKFANSGAIGFGDKESYTDPYLGASGGTVVLVTESCAFEYDLASAVGSVQWLIAGKVLIQGTTRQEIVLQESVEGRINPNIYTQPLVKHEIHGHNGSTSRIAIAHTDGIFHINGNELKLLTYSTEKQSYVSTSISLHSNVVGPYRQAAISTKPWTIIWLVSESGELYSFTYEPKNQVFAWAKHYTLNSDGTKAQILSIATIRTDADEKIHLIVKRDTGYYHELMRPIDPTEQKMAACLDCAVTSTSPTPAQITIDPTSTHQGNGKTYTLGVMAEGGLEQPALASATISAQNVTALTVGIEYPSIIKTCVLRKVVDDASTVGKPSRPTEAAIVVHRTLGIKVGTEDSTAHPVIGRDWDTPLGQAQEWLSGEVKAELNATYEPTRLVIESSGALLFEIIGIKTTLKSGGQ